MHARIGDIKALQSCDNGENRDGNSNALVECQDTAESILRDMNGAIDHLKMWQHKRKMDLSHAALKQAAMNVDSPNAENAVVSRCDVALEASAEKGAYHVVSADEDENQECGIAQGNQGRNQESTESVIQGDASQPSPETTLAIDLVTPEHHEPETAAHLTSRATQRERHLKENLFVENWNKSGSTFCIEDKVLSHLIGTQDNENCFQDKVDLLQREIGDLKVQAIEQENHAMDTSMNTEEYGNLLADNGISLMLEKFRSDIDDYTTQLDGILETLDEDESKHVSGRLGKLTDSELQTLANGAT